MIAQQDFDVRWWCASFQIDTSGSYDGIRIATEEIDSLDSDIRFGKHDLWRVNDTTERHGLVVRIGHSSWTPITAHVPIA